jgi:plastocyanin
VQSGTVTLGGGATSVTSGAGVATKTVVGGPAASGAVVRASTTSVAGTNLDFSLTVTLPPVAVSIGNFFFRSGKNTTQNPAVDTTAVGQPVRWTVGIGGHTVRSLGSPSFTSSTGTLGTGDSYTIIFSTPGTYEYDCAIHGAAVMNGRVVVIP